MINTFNVIAIFGTGNITYMAGGISEALITTMLGLIVAIPTLFFHSYLSSKVDVIISDMEKNAVILSNFLSDYREKIIAS
jgi:biopolymer transport protein ExbB